MKSCKVIGIRFDNLSMEDAITYVDRTILTGGRKVLSFSNPEFVVEAQKNKFLRRYLNDFSAANLPDGIGVVWASKLFGNPLKERVTGTDFVPRIIQLSIERGYRIYFLGGRPGVASRAKNLFAEIYGTDVVVGCQDGFFNGSDSDRIIKHINECRPHILMICLGNPKQEAWIFDNFSKLTANVVFGNGGALDFWSGSVQRAPLLIQRMGLEWLFRLGQDFTYTRFKRQLKLLTFVALVGKHSIKKL